MMPSFSHWVLSSCFWPSTAICQAKPTHPPNLEDQDKGKGLRLGQLRFGSQRDPEFRRTLEESVIRSVINDLSVTLLVTSVLLNWPGNLNTIYNLVFIDKYRASSNIRLETAQCHLNCLHQDQICGWWGICWEGGGFASFMSGLDFSLFWVTHGTPGSICDCMHEWRVKGLVQVHWHTWGSGTWKRPVAKDFKQCTGKTGKEMQ